MTPVVLHVVRPYSSEDEYLAAEAWTIEARGMLLIGQREVELDRPVVFDVSLTNGNKIIRAEGRAIGFQPSSEDHPGGLRIRFRRFGAQTKAFIDRAMSAREQNLATSMSSRPPAPPPGAAAAPEAAPVPGAASSTPEASSAPVASAVAHARSEPLERSGVHRRPAGPVEAPVNRDELLSRLRQRVVKASPRVELAAADGERSAENG
jgi:hypothetical protein